MKTTDTITNTSAHKEQATVAATARLRYLHIAPRKVRVVADVVRGLPVLEAEAQLAVSPRRASVAILKLLRSAAQNAKHNERGAKEQLFISRIEVNEGPVLKRVERRSRGSINVLRKEMSHISLELTAKPAIRTPRYRVAEPEKKERKEKKEKPSKEEVKKEPATSKAPVERQEKKRTNSLKRIFRRKSV